MGKVNFNLTSSHIDALKKVRCNHSDIDMAPRASTKAQAKTEQGQSDSNSQDASQDSGVLLGQMASKFGDQMKRKARQLLCLIRTSLMCEVDGRSAQGQHHSHQKGSRRSSRQTA